MVAGAGNELSRRGHIEVVGDQRLNRKGPLDTLIGYELITSGQSEARITNGLMKGNPSRQREKMASG